MRGMRAGHARATVFETGCRDGEALSVMVFFSFLCMSLGDVVVEVQVFQWLPTISRAPNSTPGAGPGTIPDLASSLGPITPISN